MTKARPVENDVKDDVKKLLDEFGWKHWPGSAGPFTVGGVSDRLAVRGRPGKGCIFLAIEVKLKQPKGSVIQEKFLADVREQGGIGIVVNADKVPMLRRLLEAIDRHLFPERYAPVKRYWHHPESDSTFSTEGTDDPRAGGGDAGLVEEIDEATYHELIAKHEQQDAETTIVFGDFGWSRGNGHPAAK